MVDTLGSEVDRIEMKIKVKLIVRIYENISHLGNHNFDETLIFKCPLFNYFVQETNYIWIIGRASITPHGYMISLASCTKWPNRKQSNVSI